MRTALVIWYYLFSFVVGLYSMVGLLVILSAAFDFHPGPGDRLLTIALSGAMMSGIVIVLRLTRRLTEVIADWVILRTEA